MGLTKRQIEEQNTYNCPTHGSVWCCCGNGYLVPKDKRIKAHQDRVTDLDETVITIEQMNKIIDEQNRR